MDATSVKFETLENERDVLKADIKALKNEIQVFSNELKENYQIITLDALKREYNDLERQINNANYKLGKLVKLPIVDEGGCFVTVGGCAVGKSQRFMDGFDMDVLQLQLEFEINVLKTEKSHFEKELKKIKVEHSENFLIETIQDCREAIEEKKEELKKLELLVEKELEETHSGVCGFGIPEKHKFGGDFIQIFH